MTETGHELRQDLRLNQNQGIYELVTGSQSKKRTSNENELFTPEFTAFQQQEESKVFSDDEMDSSSKTQPSSVQPQASSAIKRSRIIINDDIRNQLKNQNLLTTEQEHQTPIHELDLLSLGENKPEIPQTPLKPVNQSSTASKGKVIQSKMIVRSRAIAHMKQQNQRRLKKE
jgi:hypothetical protein